MEIMAIDTWVKYDPPLEKIERIFRKEAKVLRPAPTEPQIAEALGEIHKLGRLPAPGQIAKVLDQWVRRHGFKTKPTLDNPLGDPVEVVVNLSGSETGSYATPYIETTTTKKEFIKREADRLMNGLHDTARLDWLLTRAGLSWIWKQEEQGIEVTRETIDEARAKTDVQKRIDSGPGDYYKCTRCRTDYSTLKGAPPLCPKCGCFSGLVRRPKTIMHECANCKTEYTRLEDDPRGCPVCHP